MPDIAKYRKVLERLIDEGQELKILTLISRLHPDDIAHLIDELEEEQKTRLFRLLDVETAADVIMELDDISRELILEDIPDDKLTEIIDDMPSDDVADFIAELPEDQAQRVLSSMDQEKSEDVQRLLEYPEDSAGGIMQTELVALDRGTTVTGAIEHIRSRRDEVENVHTVYVLDDESRLVGELPLGSLLFADGDTPLKDIMDKQVIAATAGMDQEEVAALFRKYDLVSLPVVDADKRILGRILVDDIIDVIQEEVSEDMFRMAGISEEEDVVYSGHTLTVCMKRLPWLVFNFFGTLISGYFLWLYQSKLTDLLALLAFVPVICAMSGNIGVQSTSIVIRGIATGRVDFSNLRKLIFKESAVGLIIGLVCGLLGGLIGFLWQASWLIGIVVFVAMFIAIAFGALLGVLVPLFFKKIKIDPAVASGSLIATTNDLIAINIYFLLAAFMMKYFAAA
ncbi:MAG: magnesium transporter [Deltaproteobacteria bacterium]|nr:magnesium transporter [Deltaproteobacteria bacterium]